MNILLTVVLFCQYLNPMIAGKPNYDIRVNMANCLTNVEACFKDAPKSETSCFERELIKGEKK